MSNVRSQLPPHELVFRVFGVQLFDRIQQIVKGLMLIGLHFY
jgi:hypothetical protein